ncbi:hypothetical protein B7463_g3106, partial [Scytalidium lignicola]
MAGHETVNGVGVEAGHEVISSTYSTRSSKRKASQVSNYTPPGTHNGTSSVNGDEPSTPMVKRRRTRSHTPQSSMDPKSSPEEEAIVVQEDPAYTDSSTTENTPAPELQSGEDDATVAVAAPPSYRGRGGGRGRGRGRGRGGRGGGRGGRATAAAATGDGPDDVVGAVLKPTRGKGGHRVKRSDNARIQSLYLRKHNIKTQYRHVLQYQKKALDLIAEKSLDMMLDDPKFHERLPEYFETKNNLDLIYKKKIEQFDRDAKIHRDYLSKLRSIKDAIMKRQFTDTIEDINDKVESRIKEAIMEVEDNAKARFESDEVASNHGDDMSHIKYFEAEAAVHPADAWINGGREAWIAAEEERKTSSKRGRGRRSGISKKSSPIKASPMKAASPPLARKTSLYRPVAQQDVGTPTPFEGSMAPTPLEMSERETPESSSDGEVDARGADKYGVYLPNKPTPRNGEAPSNRFAQEPFFQFEDYEIGIRKHHYRGTRADPLGYLGMDTHAQPKMMHFDREARNCNSAENKPGDLDSELVKRFKVHPIYGIPIKGSINPTINPTRDWTKPLAETKPIIFKTSDGETLHTSRSAWVINADKNWEEQDAQRRMKAALTAMNELEEPVPAIKIEVEPELALPVKEKNTEEIHRAVSELLQAAEQIKATAQQMAPPPTPPQPTRRISRGYDAVRDIGHPSLPSYQPPRVGGVNLDLLADTALRVTGPPLQQVVQTSQLQTHVHPQGQPQSQPQPHQTPPQPVPALIQARQVQPAQPQPIYPEPRSYSFMGPPPLPRYAPPPPHQPSLPAQILQPRTILPPPPPPQQLHSPQLNQLQHHPQIHQPQLPPQLGPQPHQPQQYPSPFSVPGRPYLRELRPALPQNRTSLPPPPPPPPRWYSGPHGP